MKKVYSQGLDIHHLTGANILGLSSDEFFQMKKDNPAKYFEYRTRNRRS